jgi:hypothetical protein
LPASAFGTASDVGNTDSMPPQRRRLLLFLAWAAALCFVVYAVGSFDYAPGAHTVSRLHVVHRGIAAAHHVGLAEHVGLARALRKLYSVVAFTIVGTLATASFPGRWAPRFWRSTALVAGLSACIEVLQNVPVWDEPIVWNLVDIGCGAIGGALGTWLWYFVARIAAARTAATAAAARTTHSAPENGL